MCIRALVRQQCLKIESVIDLLIMAISYENAEKRWINLIDSANILNNGKIAAKITELLSIYPTLVDVCNSNGKTMLHVKCDCSWIVKDLIDHNADCNLLDVYGYSVLDMAIFWHVDINILIMLLDNGANFGKKVGWQYQYVNYTIAKILFEYGLIKYDIKFSSRNQTLLDEIVKFNDYTLLYNLFITNHEINNYHDGINIFEFVYLQHPLLFIENFNPRSPIVSTKLIRYEANQGHKEFTNRCERTIDLLYTFI
jgi:hypothetical protein